MNGFVCILDRSGANIDSRFLARLAEPLDIYGATASEASRGQAGIVIRHHGRNASEYKSCEPVTDPETGITLALAGQINFPAHTDIGQTTGCPPAPPATTKQVLDVFLEKGVDFLARVSGSFALVALDPRQSTLTIARSHLGDLKLYYYLDRRWLIAASEPAAILRHPAVADDIDEGAAARFLGFQFRHTTSSFFRQIKELPPAHWLRVNSGTSRSGQYWRFGNRRDVRGCSRETVPAEFRKHFTQSVANQTAGLEPEELAVSLSGGMDSTTLAALAPRGTMLFSWYFEDTPEGDEREHIKLVSEHLHRPVHWVRGDGHYPLCGDYVDTFVHVNSPYFNAFGGLKHRLYRAARQGGCRKILVGDGGDLLYAARDYWLRDLMLHGQPGALLSVIGTIRKAGQGDGFARLALRRLLPVRHIRSALGLGRIPWMTAAARALLPRDALSPILPKGARKYRFDPGAGAKYIELQSEERRLFALCGVDRANPFWYWPLLEMALNLPAYWYHRDGVSKILAREAMKGLLPDQVLVSGRIGLLGSFFLRGIELNRRYISETVFRQPRSDWQRYVRREWVEPYLSETGRIAFGHTILWRVISYELWYRRLMQ